MKKLLTTLILPLVLSVGLTACNKGDANKSATEAEKPAATSDANANVNADKATLENLTGTYKAGDEVVTLDRVGNTNEYTLNIKTSEGEVMMPVEARLVGGNPELYGKSKETGEYVYVGKFEGRDLLDDEGKFYKRQ